MKSLLTTILLCFSFNSIAVAVNPNVVLMDIKKAGADNVVRTLNDNGEWQDILKSIRTGKSEWLSVAKAIQPGTDAGTAEDLTEAVAFAIPNNPQGVLSILNDDTNLNVNNVCILPVYNVSDDEYNKLVVDSIRVLYKQPNSKECIDRMVNNIGRSLNPQKDL